MRVAATIVRAVSMATAMAGAVIGGAGCGSSSSSGGVGGVMGSGAGGSHGTGGSAGALGGVVGGAGGSGATDAGASHDGGPGGVGAGAGGSAGLGGAFGGCHATLAAVSPPDLGKLEVFPDAFATVSASASGTRSTPVSFVWEVLWLGPTGTTVVATTPLDTAQTVVKFPVTNEGEYLVTARVAGELTCMDNGRGYAQRAVFSLRATARGYPVQATQLNLRSGDTQPATVRLDPGVTVSFAPRQAGGAALLGYARVSSLASELAVEGDTFRGPLVTQLLPASSYDVLVIPDDTLALAPLLVSGPPAVWQGQALVVDAGIPIQVTVRDGANRPLAGARMILRQGALPSTVGTSDASGLMQLWARSGTLNALVLPPDASGLAQASVGSNGSPGVVLGDVAAMDMQMTWDAVTTAPLTVQVRGSDGATPIAGAQVHATSRAPAGTPPAAVAVATLVTRVGTSPAVTLRAVGATDIAATTDAGGVATFSALPVGDLTLLVVPPVGADGSVPSSTAITSVQITLVRGGPTQPVTLAQRVALSGQLMPASDAAGAIVTGVDASISAPGRVVTTTVGADGRFSLMVDPGRTYQLIADPLAGATVARAMLGKVTSGTGDTTMPARTLPTGHLVSGTVTAAAVGPIAGARLQVFCPAWSSQCPNPDFALDTVVTDTAGRFQLRLPEPPAP